MTYGVQLEDIPHGEYRGYVQHRKHKLPIDADDSCGCRAANAQYKRDNQASRKAAGLPDNNNRARRKANV